MGAVEPRPMRVLVVDDEPAIRLVVQLALEHAEVIDAADAYAAMRALVEGPPVDVLLVDVMMPAMSGLDLVAFVRGSARFADLAIVMLTARTREPDYRAAFVAGADAYVSKPFDAEALEPLLRDVLARTPEERARRRAEQLAVAELLGALPG
jgi:DNA-binding response OmpR family regulator